MSLTAAERQLYQQAVSAFIQGQYEAAKVLTQQLIAQHPRDPNIHLLQGHIFLGMTQYEAAKLEYEAVLATADGDVELLECAQNSLSDIEQFLGTIESTQGELGGGMAKNEKEGTVGPILSQSLEDVQSDRIQEDLTIEQSYRFDSSLELQPSDPVLLDSSLREPAQADSHAITPPPVHIHHTSDFSEIEEEDDTWLMNRRKASNEFTEDSPHSMENYTESEFKFSLSTAVTAMQDTDDRLNQSHLDDADLALEDQVPLPDDATFDMLLEEDEKGELDSMTTEFLQPMTPSTDNADSGELSQNEEGLSVIEDENSSEVTMFLEEEESQEDLTSDLSWSEPSLNLPNDGLPEEDFDDLEVLNTEFLNNLETPEALKMGADENEGEDVLPDVAFDDSPNSGAMGVTSPSGSLGMQPKRNPGILVPFVNASFQKKQLMMAGATGAMSALAVVVVGQIAGGVKPAALGIGAAGAGVAGGLTTFLMGQVVTRQIKRSTNDLQAQLAAVAQGDWTVKATEYSEDEFGQLARSFNEMTQYIESATQEVQQKAEDQEKAKEDLQRQVIRLLDDVEGAARGDLTVQAEVTADILGAVADSFNLTIYNLQKIVKQVKVAAREVSYGAAENEEFARSLSSDALKQAEELAATLNSVQMMTNSIQEVADRARSADEVAQKASETALKGGQAVEQTVSGILQIRETVAETTRKVKRLAESSQEISKIVGFISQIASRTNLLALNASIEAARAGESGRGFAVVADEVRQLADRASKASKEIEQIVLQIQGETSSVMTAMEEGTQQVIDGTQKAEQAKRSLDDIIQVSSQINQLVSSITQATEEQTETSRYVAQVMQSVELTAQETSQESQRVSDSLRSLVGVARDLQASVERFKVEGTEVS